ncbi:hypothetical protein [Mucilaginibacter pineti]|nr:hypothetical protein [Mucilaginibacter pineti]
MNQLFSKAYRKEEKVSVTLYITNPKFDHYLKSGINKRPVNKVLMAALNF